VIISREKENALIRATEPCQVRSGTHASCHRPASVRIGGVPFCEPCAREQEAYFAVVELTERSRSPHDDERLVGLLSRMWGSTQRRRIHASGADAA